MMVSKTKKWGNSLGIIIPAKEVRRMQIKPDQEIIFEIQQNNNPLKELFGNNEKIGVDKFREFRSSLEPRT